MARGRFANELPVITDPADTDGVLLGQGALIKRQPFTEFRDRVREAVSISNENWSPDDPLSVANGGTGGAAAAADFRAAFDIPSDLEAWDRLNQSNNIFRFGAVGDGVADDAGAIVGALNAGGEAVVPAGFSYVLTPDLSEAATLLAGISRLALARDVTIQLPAGTISVASGNIASIDNPTGGRLKIRGAPVLARTISAVVSATGSAGNRLVTVTLNDGSGVAVGDFVRVKNVTPGVGAPGSYSGAIPFGAMRLGFFTMGTISTSGTTATTSGSVATTHLADGDMVVVLGQVRRISGLGPSSFTLSSALNTNASGIQYWYHLKAATGTVSVSGTTVTGTGTAFTTQYNVGDLIAFADSGIRRVTAIASDTSLTIDRTITSTISGAAIGVVTLGEIHEGCWRVTAVAGNNVTWKHTGRSSRAPAVNNVNGGNVEVIKTVLDNTGSGSGIVVTNSFADLDMVAIVGDNGTGPVAVDLRGTDTGQSSRVRLGPQTAIVGFDYAVRVSTGQSLFAQDGMFSSARVRGIDLSEGGQAWLQGAVSSGHVGHGILIGPGAYARLSDARFFGNSLSGARMEVGGGSWADFAYFEDNGEDGFKGIGGSLFHGVGARYIGNADIGIKGENGLYGRASGALVLCNGGTGLSLVGGSFETNQATAVGNASGAIVQRGVYSFESAGLAFNGSYDLRQIERAIVHKQSLTTVGAATTSLSIDKFLRETYNFGTVAANTQVSNTFTVTGVVVGDVLSWSYTGTIPNGFSVTATISASNSVRVDVTNHTASGVAFGNKTWTFLGIAG